MAACDSNDGDGCSPGKVEFSNKADNLKKQMDVITSILENLEKVMEDKSNFVTQQELAYSPQELGKTEEELRHREVQLFSVWQELRTVESLFRTKDKTLRKTFKDIKRLSSDMVGNERQERSTEQEFRQEIEKKKEQMETEIKSKDKTDWERTFAEQYNRSLILGMEEFRLESQTNQKRLHDMKSKKEDLKRRADTVKVTLETLSKKADTLKRSIEQERLAVGRELRRLGGQLKTGEVGPQQEQEVAVVTAVGMLAAAATEIRKYKREEEATGSAEEDYQRIETESQKTENEVNQKNPKTRKGKFKTKK